MILKIVVVMIFIAALGATMVWSEAEARLYTPAKRKAVGATAVIGWIMTFGLASLT